MSMSIVCLFLVLAFATSCDTVTVVNEKTDSTTWAFNSNFDNAEYFSDLVPANLTAWTMVQCVEPNGTQVSKISGPTSLAVSSGANVIELSTTQFVSGTKALHFSAPVTGASVSKAAIAKEGLDFKPGDRVVAQFKLFLTDNGSATNLFIMDFESTQKMGYPGRRLAISSSQELWLESKGAGGAYNSGPNFNQPSGSKVAMPKGQWVDIKVELLLSRTDSGSGKVWQNGVLVLNATGKTFPSETDITHYDWVEFGATANSSPSTQSLWIDDVSITKN